MQGGNALCRCFYGGAWQGEQGEDRGFSSIATGVGALSSLEMPEMPEVTGALSYSTKQGQSLRGQAIREGELWQLSAQDSVQPVRISLFVNGFSLTGPTKTVTLTFSPFCLVRNCKFQSNYSTTEQFSHLKVFKVALYTQNICLYFGVKSEDSNDAEEERSQWVMDISTTIRLVTQSLFPPFRILCDPIGEIASTHTRLMAGYLLHSDSTTLLSVVYCELHAQQGEYATLMVYQNEACKEPMLEICLTAETLCVEKVGINCSCFTLDEHDLSSRTLSERKVWIRAISNIKVKLSNNAPPPDDEELIQYREAVKDHLQSIKSSLHSKIRMDALLPPSCHYSFRSAMCPLSASLWAGMDEDENVTPRLPKAPVAALPASEICSMAPIEEEILQDEGL
eukprot:TRINITY_DN33643_c0_g1_i1.p1 TRINITY_DN33643_c0_g1~~TRINITY_DN33643_c0_g1_i1.p1  ORF type:complete len:395 (+),score=68.94 TRINITY_DN33643_c0_g1_i1:78-1262(+)